MTPDWIPLDRELAIWADMGLTLPIWWRDDDATRATPALDQLLTLAGDLRIPVHLAVIPADADPSLTRVLTDWSIPVVHGWAHRNHAAPGQKKAEFGAHGAHEHIAADIARGFDRLSDLFGDRLRPVFVPPWNRIAPAVFAPLAQAGYRAISAFTPRDTARTPEGLHRINTHLDPIDWRGTRSLVDPQTLIAQMTRQLQDRRTGRADNAEPYGILTHHLVHDDAIWRFTEDLFSRLVQGPVQVWTAHDLMKGP